MHFNTVARINGRARLAAGLLAIALAGLAWAASNNTPPTPAGHARSAPLAAKNLLLAGAQAGERLVAVGEYGHVLLSDDHGKLWRQAASVPSITTLTAVQFIDAQHGWAVGHGGVVLGTSDGGEHWASLSGQLDGKEVLLSVWFKNADQGLVVGAFGYAARTADGGKTWDRFDMAPGEAGERHLNQLFTGPGTGNNNTSLWVAAEAGTLFRSDDDGAHWATVALPYKGSIWGGMRTADGALLVWGMRGHVLRSADGGKSFSVVTTGTDQSLSGGVQLAPGGTVMLAGLGGAVLQSNDGGQSFAASVRDDRAGNASVLPGPQGQVVLLGSSGALLQPLQAGKAAAPAASAASSSPGA